MPIIILILAIIAWQGQGQIWAGKVNGTPYYHV